MSNEELNKQHNKQYITLTRNDLIEWKKNIPFQDVTINDFKDSSITMDEVLKAHYIVFSDINIHKVIKDKR